MTWSPEPRGLGSIWILIIAASWRLAAFIVLRSLNKEHRFFIKGIPYLTIIISTFLSMHYLINIILL